jgi:hypothetical protein
MGYVFCLGVMGLWIVGVLGLGYLVWARWEKQSGPSHVFVHVDAWVKKGRGLTLEGGFRDSKRYFTIYWCNTNCRICHHRRGRSVARLLDVIHVDAWVWKGRGFKVEG